MSGHSKWATIHRQKEVSDQKRGAVFTKIANAIIIAVRDSGGITEPEGNFKLRLAIEKARSVNMPKDNIQRAIDRAVGKADSGQMEQITYEGYGPNGVGFLVETTTDNRQRTIQEIKNIFDRAGGSIASPGAVSYNFEKMGLLSVPIAGNREEAILKIIDLGAEDVEDLGNGVLGVYTMPEKLIFVKDNLVQSGFNPSSVELIEKPVNLIQVTDEKICQQLISLVEKLESLDDVQRVYTNFDISEELLGS